MLNDQLKSSESSKAQSSQNDPLKLGGQEAATKSNAIEIPQISLPKGGGALKGIDEKFQVNAANGTASSSIPLPISPGRNGFQPSLALSYNSGAGNSLFGVGWDLGYPSIQRKTDKKLPRYRDYEDSDTFMFSGVEDLVPVLKPGSKNDWVEDNPTQSGTYKVRRYRPRIEGSFSRIERITNDKGTMWWKVTTRDNTVTFFGKSDTHRIADPADPSRIFQWLPELSFDDKGNCMLFEFKAENLDNVTRDVHEANRHKKPLSLVNKHLKRVYYGNKTAFYPGYITNAQDWDAIYDTVNPKVDNFLFELVFDYGEHGKIEKAPTNAPATGWNGTATVSHDEIPGSSWLARSDAFSNYRPGFEVRTYRLCRRVLMFHHFEELNEPNHKGSKISPCLVRSLDFEYRDWTKGTQASEGKKLEMTYLDKVTQRGYIRTTQHDYRYKSLPPMSFEYQELAWNRDIRDVTPENLANAPVGLSSGYQFTDFFGEGIAGILTEQGDGWYYKENLGGGAFTIAKPIMPKPSFTGLANGVLQLQDLGADGSKQIVVMSAGLQGYFELSDDNEWEGFRPFRQVANVDLRDPHTRMLDLNGDGQPDIVISKENEFSWFPSAGRVGYDSPELAPKPFDEEQGPAIVFADSIQSIFIADMSGDGLADIVRIRNGEVCYWPNLGYGRFGAKVNMGNAPVFDTPDQFNPAYLQLADISGTGLTDIIYLGKNQFRAWLNLSGNGWSAPADIDPFPQTASPAQISVTDLLGNGTSCIVWSSPIPAHAQVPMRYIDLMGGVKPHIMKAQHNGMGKTTRVNYKSSTQFYLADKAAGKPWITKLPFPVHCVEKVEIEDAVAGLRFANEYSYHHGYYDHAEREFRGFGRVDQTDTEDYDLTTPELDVDLWQPPVLTRTWFHTGVFFRKDKILHLFEEEYWYNDPIFNGLPPFDEHQLPDAVVKASKEYASAHTAAPAMEDVLTAIDYREAARACKGMTLRQEVFALDANHYPNDPEAPKKQLTPYSVVTHNCHIMALQPSGKQPYAVFMPLESEAITWHYERNTADPRIGHSINLEIDERGNVLKSVAIAYARRQNPTGIPASLSTIQVKDGLPVLESLEQKLINGQTKEHVILTETTFTDENRNNVISYFNWRLRMPFETRTYELNGATKQSNPTYYHPSDFDNFKNALPYGDAFSTGKEKRLTEHVKTLYLDANLTTAFPEGEHGPGGLAYEAYQQAFTTALLGKVFNDTTTTRLANIPQNMTDAKYVDLDNNGNWWIRSGQVQLLQPGETIQDVRDRFYTPHKYVDPFGAPTTVEVEPNYHLYISKITDALGNVTKIEDGNFDFRTLSPRRMKDLNDNESEVVTDALGLVVATAIRGKFVPTSTLHPDHSESGDNLENYTVELPDVDLVAFKNAPKASAAALLGDATARMIYDFRQTPAWVATIARETHVADLKPGDTLNTQVSFEYTGGLGQVLLKKVQAEPGMAKPPGGGPEVPASPRWVGNGRTILNNKGNPIKQYEPYFSTTHAYETEAEVRELGVTPILHYDPIGRVIRTDMPDDTFTKVEFTPWEQKTYDQNDTVGRRKTDGSGDIEQTSKWYNDRIKGAKGPQAQKAAEKAAVHADTPTVVYTDSLGRPFFSVAHNRWNKPSGNTFLVTEEFYATYVELDIEGNQRSVTDARGNVVMSWKYDMLGHQVYQDSMDGGKRWMLNDCMGKPFFHWDSKAQAFETKYDLLHRPLHQLLHVGTNTVRFEEIIYGTVADIDKNLNGQIKEHRDTAGVVELHWADYKGNPLESSRRLLELGAKGVKNKQVFDYTTFNAANSLEPERFYSITQYDALNRPLLSSVEYQDTARYANPRLNVQAFEYDEAGLLKKVWVTLPNKQKTVYVKGIKYDAKGQRLSIKFGNGTKTEYTYDPFTLRLQSLLTDGGPTVWQDLKYTYDPVGNITTLIDAIQPDVYNHNARIKPEREYTYDAIYRLVEAKGREAVGLNQPSDQKDASKYLPIPNYPPSTANKKNLRAYTQTYHYDSVGNMLEMNHTAGTATNHNQWTRLFTNATNNNQLKQTDIGGNTTKYRYDPHGNMRNLIQGAQNQLTWNFRDELKCYQDGGAEVWYSYDGGGQRVRKVDLSGANPTERIYFGGFELYRERNVNNGIIRESLHVMDDQRRIALIETLAAGTDTYAPELIRYQYGDHLGSSVWELTQHAEMITYEEYYPYGSMAVLFENSIKFSLPKRYRYTGMERDEESGLNYHGARYYAGWLGRWTAVDPKKNKQNLFIYCSCNPVNKIDNNGAEDGWWQTTKKGIRTAQKWVHEKSQNIGEKIQDRNEREMNDLGIKENTLLKSVLRAESSVEAIMSSTAVEVGVGMLMLGPNLLMLPEALSQVPEQLGYGASEIVEGVRTGDSDRALLGAGHIFGAVGTVASTIALVAGAGESAMNKLSLDLGPDFVADFNASMKGPPPPPPPPQLKATLKDSKASPFKPSGKGETIYTGDNTPPEAIIKQGGFKAKGKNTDALEHVEGRTNDSAFRGGTFHIQTANGQGAAQWAGEGNWVYKLRRQDYWDMNSILGGRVKRPDGTFGGNPMKGEIEFSVPGDIPLSNIESWAQVIRKETGLRLGPWQENPHFKP